MTPLILTLLFVLIVAISALVGFVRGLNKSVIRIMTFVLAIILTFVLAGPITNLVAESIKIEGQTLGEMILSGASSNEMLAGILEAAPLMEEAILVAPAFVMAIVIFPVAFFLLSFISWIVFLCVQKPLRKLIFKDDGTKKEEKTKVRIGKKFAGLGIGVVTGALIFGMIMTPVFGLLSVLPEKSTIDEVIDTMEEQDMIESDLADTLKSELGVMDSFIVKAYGVLGATPVGRAYLASVSKIEADGQSTKLTDEFDSLFAVAQTAIEGGLLNALMESENQDALYAALSDAEFVNALMQDMFNSKLLRSAIPEVTAIALESAARMLGVPENKEAVYDNMMDSIAEAVKTADINYAGIQAYEEANNISYIDTVDGGDNGLMTEEEYLKEKEKVTELTNKISSIVSKNVAGGDTTLANSIADNFVKDVQKQVRENGADAVKNFAADNVKNTISAIDPEKLEKGDSSESAESFLGKLTNPEKFETNVATVETVKESIRESVKSAVADDSKSQETASTLANVVSNFAGAVSGATGEDGNLDPTKLDFEKVAGAVTSLQNSTLKDVGSTVLDIVASGDLGGNSMISDAIGAVKDSYDNGEDISGTIGSAGALIGLGSAMNNSNGEATEDMIKSFTSLIQHLDETTMKLLPSILTKDTIVSLGVPADYAQAAYDVIETLLRELMALKGADDYENEVNAVVSIYNLATSGIEKFQKEDISKLVDYAVKSDAIFNTLKSVSTSNPFGIEIEGESTRAELVKAIEEGYAESGKTARERDIFNAVATLLGIDEEVKLG